MHCDHLVLSSFVRGRKNGLDIRLNICQNLLLCYIRLRYVFTTENGIFTLTTILDAKISVRIMQFG